MITSFKQTYAPLFSVQPARSVFLCRLGARLAPSALPVVMLVLLREQGRSLSATGLVLAAYMLGSGLGQTMSSMLLGRFPLRRLVLTLALLNLLLLGGTLALIVAVAPIAVIGVACALAGLAEAPTGAIIRIFWEQVHGPERAQSAFALEIAASFGGYVACTLLAAALLAITTPEVTFALLAVGTGLSSTGYAYVLPTWLQFLEDEQEAPSGVAREGHAWRPLLVVFAVGGGWSLAFAVFEFILPAQLTDLGHPSLAASALALASVGGALAALAHGHHIHRWSVRRQMMLGLTLLAASLVVFGYLGEQAVGVLLAAGILVGLTSTPPMTLSDVWVMERASARVKARAYAVLGLAFFIGGSGGALLAGALMERFSLSVAASVAALVCVACAFAASMASEQRQDVPVAEIA